MMRCGASDVIDVVYGSCTVRRRMTSALHVRKAGQCEKERKDGRRRVKGKKCCWR